MKFSNGIIELKNHKKYSFKPYQKDYVDQFNSEKKILTKILSKNARIEHFGSTAVPKLGGKGMIDIIIEVPKKDFLKSKRILEKNGYEYKPHFKKRLFFKKYYKNRKVHVHLTYIGTNEIARAVSVRNYLIKNKKEAKKYEDIKKKAVKHAKGIGQKYRDYKKPYLDRLEKRAIRDYIK